MRRRHRSVAFLVSTVTIVVATVLLGGFGFVFSRWERNRSLSHFKTDLSNDADRLSAGLSIPVWNLDDTEIWMMLDSIFINRSITSVSLHTDDLDYSLVRTPDGTIKREIPAVFRGDFKETRKVLHEGSGVGTLILFADFKPVLAQLTYHTNFLIFVIAALDVVLIACLLVLFRVIILKPLSALERYAAEFDGTKDGTGALDTALFRGELATLRESLAKMIDLLQARHEDQKAAEKKLHDLNVSLEARVKERTAELERLNSELESFSYSVSHDLRAPLRAISGFAALLKEDCPPSLDAAASHKLEVIDSNVKKMDSLIQGLLALSGVSRSGITFIKIDMTKAARQAFDEALDDSTRKQFSVSIAELPPAWGDLILIRQIFVNLISNAVKYSMKSVEKRIEVDGWMEGDSCVYRVSDHGVGFNQAYSGKLFEAFQRLHSDLEFRGTGIGLALVKRITLRHGGKVWAEGEEGKGARFFFSLPARMPI